jgi:hypothetical protein
MLLALGSACLKALQLSMTRVPFAAYMIRQYLIFGLISTLTHALLNLSATDLSPGKTNSTSIFKGSISRITLGLFRKDHSRLGQHCWNTGNTNLQAEKLCGADSARCTARNGANDRVMLVLIFKKGRISRCGLQFLSVFYLGRSLSPRRFMTVMMDGVLVIVLAHSSISLFSFLFLLHPLSSSHADS